jgi:hypothetical protein
MRVVDEQAVRAAAFGAVPEQDVTAATLGPPRSRWLAAVALGGQGRYAAAATALAGLLTGPDRVLASFAASTLASHHRQLGDHATARPLDGRALALLADVPTGEAEGPTDEGPLGARSDALLGLAADAVGLGRLDEAGRLHRAATELPGPAGWRRGVREAWLGAEIALSAGSPDRAVEYADRAVTWCARGTSLRHEIKTTLVRAVALETAATTNRAADDSFATGVNPDGRVGSTALLEAAMRTSLGRGMFSLAWPSALVLADAVADRRDEFTKIASEALTRVFLWSDGRSRQRAVNSPWFPTALVRSGEPTRTGAGRSS